MGGKCLLADDTEGWVERARGLDEGAYAAILVRHGHPADVGIAGRVGAGLDLRDTLLLIGPGLQTAVALLFRKPVETEAAAIDAVIKYGTGGLNISTCRVGTTGGTKRSEQFPYPKKSDGREDRSISWARTGHQVLEIEGGRWPPNVVLIHGPSCRITDGGKVPLWACEDTCPVKVLDELSGERRSAGNYPTTYSNSGGFTRGDIGKNVQGPLYSDAGGASRYFPQFANVDDAGVWLAKLLTAAA